MSFDILMQKPAYEIQSFTYQIFQKEQNIYLHFMPFLHIDLTQVVEILPQVKQDITYSIL